MRKRKHIQIATGTADEVQVLSRDIQFKYLNKAGQLNYIPPSGAKQSIDLNVLIFK